MSNSDALNITVQVPKECVIAKENNNLTVAGKNLSADREMLTCIRINRDMPKLGEVSVILAFVVLEDQVPLKDALFAGNFTDSVL